MLSMSDFDEADDVAAGQAVLGVDTSTDPTMARFDDPFEADDSGPLPGDPPEDLAGEVVAPTDPTAVHRAETARLGQLTGFVGRFLPHPGHTYREGTHGDPVRPADHLVPRDVIELRWTAVSRGANRDHRHRRSLDGSTLMSYGYWPQDYFGNLFRTPGASIPPPPLSDGGCLKWIVQTLESSQAFAAVGVGKNPRGLSGGTYPTAWVYAVGYTEDDDFDPCELTRKLKYAIVVSVQATDDQEAIDRLDSISNLVADLLSGGGPDGYVQGLSRVESGRYDGAKMNDGVPLLMAENTYLHSLTMLGTIAYIVQTRAGRLVSED